MESTASGSALTVDLSAIHEIVDHFTLPACLVGGGVCIYANTVFSKMFTNVDYINLTEGLEVSQCKEVVLNNSFFLVHRIPLNTSLLLVIMAEIIHTKVTFDSLTGLMNRDCFHPISRKMFDESRSRNSIMSVLFVDLDDFKTVNDTYGHESGDIVLKTVAERMLKVMRNNDRCFRLGGDEFVILLQDVKDKLHTCLIARRLIHSISQTIQLEGSNTARIGASIGIASFPEDGKEVDELLKNADDAMYQAKKLGKNTYRLFGQ
jgi:diguanylate cyclase (GGDEF)-like protein